MCEVNKRDGKWKDNIWFAIGMVIPAEGILEGL
jgi:hypothetical protein